MAYTWCAEIQRVISASEAIAKTRQNCKNYLILLSFYLKENLSGGLPMQNSSQPEIKLVKFQENSRNTILRINSLNTKNKVIVFRGKKKTC